MNTQDHDDFVDAIAETDADADTDTDVDADTDAICDFNPNKCFLKVIFYIFQLNIIQYGFK